MPRAPGLRAIALSLALASAAPAAAREVRVPLRLDRPFLERLLVSQVFRELGQTAVVLDDGRGCQRLVLGDPDLGVDGEALKISTRADLWVGTWFIGFCWLPLAWSGRVEIRVVPELDPASPIVHFRVVDSSAVAPEGRSDLPARTWDWIKRSVHPRLETFDVDLASPLSELRAVLPRFLERHEEDRAQRLIDSVSLADARVAGEALEVGVHLEASDAPAPAPASAPPLTPEEIERWEQSWRGLDAFLTFVVKTAGEETRADELRSDLLAVLIESREDLLETLASAPPRGPDPVRQVFLRSWQRLAPVLRDISAGIPGEEALHFLAFVAAGDALRAIDAVGPEWGLEISTDGLRRLAGVMAPDAREDPVEYGEAVDPELRRVLGFGPPLPASELPEAGLPGVSDPAPEPEPATPPAPEPPEPPGARLERWLRAVASLWVGAAHADTSQGAFDREIALRLHRWVPSRSELPTYLDLVHQVLEATSEQALEKSALAPFHRELYRPLLLATAWQESCWRQFVRARSGVRPIRSARSSVGIMQVNERVWRGFYEIASLREDLVYNARAGGEILRRYLDAFLAKAEPAAARDADRVAVATYAAYNAGPSALRRFRRGSEPPATPLDRTFSQKFRVVQAGDPKAVRSCFSGAAG